MNFLLYMLGRAGGALVGERPTVRQLLLANGARCSAEGRWGDAVSVYRRLMADHGGTPLDALIRGHLHLVDGDAVSAERFFAHGLERLLAIPSENENPQNEDGVIERHLDACQRFLQQGRFVRATDLLRRVRALIEVGLAAKGGMILARREMGLDADTAWHGMAALGKLSDLTLRMLARVHLAANVANALWQQSLRNDLAPWATPQPRADELLRMELTRLNATPRCAETHFRLGILANALGEHAHAKTAFQNVLATHREHVNSANRLALLRGNSEGPAILHAAYFVPARTMQSFAGLAEAFRTGNAFDRAVEGMGQKGEALAQTRGNLALALAEVGLLDEAHEEWRETVSV